MSDPTPEPTGPGDVLSFDDADAFRRLCGSKDSHVKLLAEETGARATVRGNTVRLDGEPDAVAVAGATLQQLYRVVRRGLPLQLPDVQRAVRIVRSGTDLQVSDVFMDTIFVASGRRRITPKNLNQKLYIDGIREHSLSFGIGPAGTGKTYLAMAMAVSALSSQEVKRIILTRPAVEAGERLGFLPGDMAEKVNPYLRPLYDALYDMLELPRVQRLMAEKAIEVAPLAFMRGRTLNDAFVVLDEAQNTTREQMKMFLTRLGFGSKAVVTGDVTQTDLPDVHQSGLHHAQYVLRGVQGIHFQEFDSEDVVRHPLVMRIIDAYTRDDERREAWRRERDAARSAEGLADASGDSGPEASDR